MLLCSIVQLEQVKPKALYCSESGFRICLRKIPSIFLRLCFDFNRFEQNLRKIEGILWDEQKVSCYNHLNCLARLTFPKGIYVYRRRIRYFTSIPKGLYALLGVFTYNPFGIRAQWQIIFYKHIFPSGMLAT